jgi:hypothetical protein
VAALVAHHASFVYRRYQGQSDWAPFLAAMEQCRDDLPAAAPRERFLAAYNILYRCGQTLLAFCFGRDSTAYPSPIPRAVPARRIPASSCRGAEDLPSTLASAPWEELTGNFPVP